MQELSETHHRPVAQKQVYSFCAISYFILIIQAFFLKKQIFIITFIDFVLCGSRNSYVVPTNLFHGIKAVNPMFRGYSQQVWFVIVTVICLKKSVICTIVKIVSYVISYTDIQTFGVSKICFIYTFFFVLL